MTESSPQKPPIPPTRVLVVDDDALCVAALVLLLSEDSRIAVIDRNAPRSRHDQPTTAWKYGKRTTKIPACTPKTVSSDTEPLARPLLRNRRISRQHGGALS